MQLNRRLILFTLTATVSTTGFTASFDCAKARTFVEKSICHHQQLSALDTALAAAYQKRLAHTKEKWEIAHVKETQKNWLHFQRNSCRSITCIGREYEERLHELLAASSTKRTFFAAAAAEKNPPSFAFGHYVRKHKIAIYDPSQPNDELISNTTDTLNIYHIPKKPQLAIVDASLTGGNAHQCSLSDDKFTWRENHWSLFQTERYSKSSNLADINCELRIYPTKNAMLIKDIKNECRRLNCGVRAGFDGAIFKPSKHN